MATSNPTQHLTLSIKGRDKFLQFAKDCVNSVATDLNQLRTWCEYLDRCYQRTLDQSAETVRAFQSVMAGNPKKIGNITVPIVMPQVESATAYQAGVFLSSYPIFGLIASPAQQDAAMQFETVLGQQSQRYGWTRELIKVLRDGFKYNLGISTVDWKTESLKKIVTDTSISAAGLAKIQNYTYGGNKIRHLSPYNTFMDTTVKPCNMHTDGTFFGHNELMTKMQLRNLVDSVKIENTTQLNEAFGSEFAVGTNGSAGYGYYIPTINRLKNISHASTNGINWLQALGVQSDSGGVNYKNIYLVTHFYCRELPSSFNNGGSEQGAIYYGIIVNWKYVIYAERLVTSHDFMPCLIMQPNEDGLGYQTQSMLESSAPFQEMASALWNSTLQETRRKTYDRILYNPKHVAKEDIDPESPVARIPVRNLSLLDKQGIQAAVFPLPYNGNGSQEGVQLAQFVSQMADESAGQNRVSRGQFQKGNKTSNEFQTTQDNSNARSQLTALTIENQYFMPMKEIIKANTLQHQTAGKILNQESKEIIDIDPVALREALLEFQTTDGVLPMEKLMNPELMQVFLQTAQAIPTLMTEYDVLGMFMYWLKLRGARWLDDFKRNPEQQQQFLSQYAATNAAQTASLPQPQAQLETPATASAG